MMQPHIRYGWHPREWGGGRGSGRKETAIDESRKETADRVAKYQADYVGRTCLCYSYCCGCPGYFCCAPVFLSFLLALGVLSATSPESARRFIIFLFYFYLLRSTVFVLLFYLFRCLFVLSAIALSTLLSRYNVVSLCRVFLTTELVSL